MSRLRDKVLIEAPLDLRPPRVTPRARSAAGFPAVWHAFSQIFKHGGFFRGLRGFLALNQKRGFDCPGCAWPDPDDHRQAAEFCENGAKALAEETTAARATPEAFGAWPVARLSELSDYRLGLMGRFTEPMILHEGADRYERLSWDEAFNLVAGQLRGQAPDEAVFYTSGKASNEAAFLFQLFARLLGTNNLPDCSNMCHESSGYALSRALGSGKGSVLLDDFNHADCILIMGQNPGTNHPRMLSSLQAAVRKGCKIVTINPLREAGTEAFRNPQEAGGMLGFATPLSSLHLPVRINGDIAVLKGIQKILLEEEKKNPGSAIDRSFINRYAEGFEELCNDLGATSWEEIERSSGLARELIDRAARVVLGSKRMITCWAMGITQHRSGVGNVQQIVNLHLLRGQLGKKGAGVCPVRGHSNVQGDRTMGIWEQMPESFLAAISGEFGFDAPRRHGYDVVGSIEAMLAGKVKTFISLGGNFQAAAPDTEAVSEAIRKVELFVHISTKPHRGHLVTGRRSLILPCLGRSEVDLRKGGPQVVTTENSMGVIQASAGHLKPASAHLRSECAIIAGMAHATFERDPKRSDIVDWLGLADDYDRIRDHIERVVPGFERFNERLRSDSGFCLPHAVRDALKFNTPSSKARFTVTPIPAVLADGPGELLLMTIRTHDQFNTTIYGEDDRYRGVRGGRRVLFMNPEDIRERGLVPGDRVDITSDFEGTKRSVRRFLVVPYEIPRKCVASYFPETNPLGQLANFADGSRQPVYKSLVVTVVRS